MYHFIMERFYITAILIAVSANSLAMDPMENPNLYEGDILMTPEQLRSLNDDGFNPNIPLSASTFTKWPKTIPYKISSDLRSETSAYRAIMDAIGDFHRHTCLRFVRRTNQKAYMSFFKGDGCYTYVGYSNRKCPISLGTGCWTKGIAMHEMAHSLGFFHEQSRPDRDNYVKINFRNMDQGSKVQFKKQSKRTVNSLGSPYDYDSVMHYGAYYFSNNLQKTIETLNPKYSKRIGQRKGFSPIDIQQMNQLYQCNGRPVVTRSPVTKLRVTRRPTTSLKRGTRCEGSRLTLYCQGRKIIIDNTLFGFTTRSSEKTIRHSCNRYKYGNQAYCKSSTSTKNIMKSCNRKKYCSIRVSQQDLGVPKSSYGSCSGLKYYVVVHYRCI